MDTVEFEADQEEPLDLTEPAARETPGEDEVLDLMDTVEFEADQEEPLDLTEPAARETPGEDEVFDLLDAVEPEKEDEEILDLSHIENDSLEDAISSSEQVEGLEPEPEDHILDLTEEADEVDRAPEETPAVTVPGPSDDQEILDLIDDIQSTLDETDGTTEETAIEEQAAGNESVTADGADQATDNQAILIGNGDLIDEDELVETEPNLVDNLGIDLTSELSRDILTEEDEEGSAADNTLGDRIEAVVEKVLQEKLDTIIGQRIEEAVQKEFEKLRKDILE